jgi:RimJ/RimL family protein N-acetyltransferase
LPGISIRRATVADADSIEAICRDSDVFPWLCDDATNNPDAMDYKPLLAIPQVCFVLVSEDGEDIGAFMFVPYNSISYELHTAFLPGHRGRKVIEAALLTMEYLFTQTPCRKVMTRIPENNRRAVVMARMCGMSQEGLDRKSFLKGGQLLDQHVFGLCLDDAREMKLARD